MSALTDKPFTLLGIFASGAFLHDCDMRQKDQERQDKDRCVETCGGAFTTQIGGSYGCFCLAGSKEAP